MRFVYNPPTLPTSWSWTLRSSVPKIGGRCPIHLLPSLIGGDMSVQAISWVFQHSESTLGPRHVLLAIANHAKSDGTGAWPSVSTIARESKLSERQVQRCFVSLAKMGELRISRGDGPHGCNLYSLPKMRGDNLSPQGRHPVARGVTFRAENDAKMSPEPKSFNRPNQRKTDLDEPCLFKKGYVPRRLRGIRSAT